MNTNEKDEMQMAALQASDLLAELHRHGITPYIERGYLRMSPSLYDQMSYDEAGPIDDDIDASRSALEAVLIAEQLVRDRYVP